MRRLKLVALGAVFLLGACDTVKLYADLPKDKNVLFWTQDQRDNGFRALEKREKCPPLKFFDLPPGEAPGPPVAG